MARGLPIYLSVVKTSRVVNANFCAISKVRGAGGYMNFRRL